jgi:ribosomal protein L3 glutamine methyltransferase
LDGGADGLEVIRRLIRQAPQRLSGEGALLIEVGGLRRAIDREFAAERPEWLRTEDASDCICLIRAGRAADEAQGAIRRHRL